MALYSLPVLCNINNYKILHSHVHIFSTDSSRAEVTINNLITGHSYVFMVKSISGFKRSNVTVSQPYTVLSNFSCSSNNSKDLQNAAAATGRVITQVEK